MLKTKIIIKTGIFGGSDHFLEECITLGQLSVFVKMVKEAIKGCKCEDHKVEMRKLRKQFNDELPKIIKNLKKGHYESAHERAVYYMEEFTRLHQSQVDELMNSLMPNVPPIDKKQVDKRNLN